jgi:preprotein translocase subunit SecB
MTGEQPRPEATKKHLMQKELLMQKIYVKDLSFESPRAPAIFATDSKPQMELGIRSNTQNLGPNLYEVALILTLKAYDQGATLFSVEISQAAIFLIEGFSAAEVAILTGSDCPRILYAFAREAVADVVGRGGFPQLLLQPVDFDALYAESGRKLLGESNA